VARVRLQKLAKQFGQTEVIRDINLDIGDGEFVVFVGPSGCGKSTLLRLIAGLEEATSGTIHIGDDDVTKLPPAKRGVSMVFQSYALYPHMDAYWNIAFGLKLPDARTENVDQRVRRVAEKLQIGNLLDRKPRELSGGQRQRVAIARAIVREPRVFLFDEPLSNLDAALRAQTRLEIARLHDELSSTMIYVTHDQQEAMTLADRIALLNKGRVEQVGPPSELYRKPATRFVATFLGSPAMNILPAQVSEGQALLSTGERIAINAQYAGPADIGIRPEAMTQAGQGEPGTVQAHVLHVEDLGDSRLLHAALSDGTVVTARYFGATATPSKGEQIAFWLEPKDLHLFCQDGRRI
jgi:ABC-type sugar transport system ATPase subunit